MNIAQENKFKRILAACCVSVFICIVCIIISIRYVDKYKSKVAETALLAQKVENLEQDIKKLDIKTKELESVRYDLSLEKGQIRKDYTTMREKYNSLRKTIKILQDDINGLHKIIKLVENTATDPLIGDVDISAEQAQLMELRCQNDKLVKKLASKTKEKMILKIALESQAKRLGISKEYDSEFKAIVKNLVTSLQ